MGVGGQCQVPAALPPQERPGTPFMRAWVGATAGLDGCGKSRPTGIQSADRPASRYTDYGTQPTKGEVEVENLRAAQVLNAFSKLNYH